MTSSLPYKTSLCIYVFTNKIILFLKQWYSNGTFLQVTWWGGVGSFGNLSTAPASLSALGIILSLLCPHNHIAGGCFHQNWKWANLQDVWQISSYLLEGVQQKKLPPNYSYFMIQNGNWVFSICTQHLLFIVKQQYYNLGFILTIHTQNIW